MPAKKTASRRKPTKAGRVSAAALAAEVAVLREQLAALRNQAKPGTAAGVKKTPLRTKASRPKRSLPSKENFASLAADAGPVYELKPVVRPSLRDPGPSAARSLACDEALFDGLFDRARMLWLMRDWAALASFDSVQISQHPDRAKLTLLVAAGCWQSNDRPRARELMVRARDYGCSETLIVRMLAAGVYTNLARIAALQGRAPLASRHSAASTDLLGAGAPSPLPDIASVQLPARSAASVDHAARHTRLADQS